MVIDEKTGGYEKPAECAEKRTQRPIQHDSTGRLPERIRKVMKGESARAFAERAGLSEGTVRNLLSGGDPRLSSLVRVAEAGGVSLAWLASDDWPDGFCRAAQEGGVTEGDFALIPRYSVEARAGHGAAVEHEQIVGRFAFRRDWLAAAGLKEKDLALITARGDSMEPTISDGDVLLIDTSVHQVNEDGVYAVRLNGHLAVKRLQRIGAGRVRVISDNSAYTTYVIDVSDDESIDPDRLTIAGRVVWSGGLL